MPNDNDDLVDETPRRRLNAKPSTAPSVDAPRVATRPVSAPKIRADALRTEPVRRRKRGSKGEDHFYIPDDLLDQLRARKLSWEFKRLTYFGKEEDPDYHIGLAENAWEPLSLKSFPDFKKLVPSTWTKDTFEKRGQVLMVRPAALTAEARAEDKAEANNQVKGQLASLKEAGANEAPRLQPSVKRSYEAMPVE